MVQYSTVQYSTVQYSTVQDIDNDIEVGVKTPLQGNGDFRNQECIDLLKECDIIVTNPPFSLFREYVAQLIEYDKKFLIIGRCDVVNYKDFFPLLKNNKLWSGYNGVSIFNRPDGTTQTFGNIGWWTNLDIKKRHEPLILWQRYYDDEGKPLPDVEERYPHYDNYNAINIDRIKNIPCDYYDVMGVPTSFAGSICPEQFEILGNSRYHDNQDFADDINVINGKAKYMRVLIKRVKREEE